MSRFTDLEQFVDSMEQHLGLKNVLKRNIKTFFVFLVFRVGAESREKFEKMTDEPTKSLKGQLNPCIYKKR